MKAWLTFFSITWREKEFNPGELSQLCKAWLYYFVHLRLWIENKTEVQSIFPEGEWAKTGEEIIGVARVMDMEGN